MDIVYNYINKEDRKLNKKGVLQSKGLGLWNSLPCYVVESNNINIKIDLITFGKTSQHCILYDFKASRKHEFRISEK